MILDSGLLFGATLYRPTDIANKNARILERK